MGQAMALARHYFGDNNPDAKTMGQALWLHGDLLKAQQIAVENGVKKAFSKHG